MADGSRAGRCSGWCMVEGAFMAMWAAGWDSWCVFGCHVRLLDCWSVGMLEVSCSDKLEFGVWSLEVGVDYRKTRALFYSDPC